MTRTPTRLVGALLALASLTAGACSDDGADASATSAETEAPEPDPGSEAGPPVAEATLIDEADEDADADRADGADAPTDEPDVAGAGFDAVAPVVEDFVAEWELGGAGLIVVERDRGVVFHDHWGEFDENRVSLIASSTKMITAGVLLHLADEGLIDLDAPVAEVVDWGAANPTITPAQLISNSSGLVGLLPDPAYAPYICQYLAIGTIQSCAETIFTTGDDDADLLPPDTEFRYGGAQWQVAGAVAEIVSGRSWAELIEEIYVAPCGLEALAYNNHFVQLAGQSFSYPGGFDADPSNLAPTENPNMEGGAYLTTGDYGKLLLMQLRDGMCGDRRVLSSDALARMHGDRIGDTYGGEAGDPGQGYGMGWWIDRDGDYLTDPGAYGSVAWLDLEDGYGAFLVIEADSGKGADLAGRLYDIVDTAVAAA